jgi:5-methylcytosine-specific restriction endonuclease McrA
VICNRGGDVPEAPEAVAAAARALRGVLAGFDPALTAGGDCARLVEELAATEKACAAARTLAAARAASCGAHRREGFRDPGDWLARQMGSSSAEARTALDTATALESCPGTRAALVSGELSLAQAGEIARTEAQRPGCEAELLDLARTSSLASLRDAARKTRLRAVDPDDLHRRQVEARHFRGWLNDLGNVCVAGELPPEVGVPFLNRVDAETDRLARQAKRQGQPQPRQALAADAVIALFEGRGQTKSKGAELVIVCDVRPFRRGHVHDGEVCQVLGAGPIPVSLARQLSADAFVKAVIHDGVNIHTVAHFGRHIPAELRTALQLGPPPDFDGVTCVEAGCGRRYGLEWDHVDPVANGGATSYDNLKARCWPHHHDKTEEDRKSGLLGPPPP